MHTQACEQSEHHGTDRLRDVRHAAADRSQSNRTIFRNDRSVRTTIEPDAESSFCSSDQRLGVRSGHAGKVINIQTALATETHALVANHLVPISLTRRRDVHMIECVSESGHGSLLIDAQPRLSLNSYGVRLLVGAFKSGDLP